MAFESLIPAQLAQGAVAASPTTLYTAPALTRALVTTIDIANTTAASVRITVYLVPSGGSPAAANTLLSNVDVPGNGSLQWTGSQVIGPGASIRATGAATGLTLTASGAEAV